MEKIDFKNKEIAAAKVNKDVELHTNGKIKKIVGPEAFKNKNT